LSVAAMAMSLIIIYQFDSIENWLDWSLSKRVWELTWLIGTGALTYLISAYIVGIRLKDLKTATS
jgi:putative peptidoglycan lipid II flippase